LALVSSCGFAGQPMNPVVQTHTACGLCWTDPKSCIAMDFIKKMVCGLREPQTLLSDS